MPFLTTRECEICQGTGQFQGGDCENCSGTGQESMEPYAHDQIETNIRYIVEQIDTVNTKLETLDTKIEAIAVQVQVLFDDLNQ